MDDETFNDLLALGNALPGPAFSQVSAHLCPFPLLVCVSRSFHALALQLAFAISCLHDGTLCGLWSFFLLTAPCAVIMTGVAFAVRRIPSTLPEVVFALFTGLNAATVGLVALAAYQLSRKVVTDPATRLILFFSGAIATCYESQWLYPVLMVAGGLTTLAVDRVAVVRAKRILKGRSASGPTPPPPDSTGPEIEMRLPRPAAPVATKSTSSGVESVAAPTGFDTVSARRGFAPRRSDSIERYPTPPLEDGPRHRRGTVADSTLSEPRVDPDEEPYFKLTIKQGLYM